MTILYFVDKLTIGGGTAKIITEKINYLAKLNYSIVVVTVEDGKNNPYFKLDPSVKVINLDVKYDTYANNFYRYDFYRRRQSLKKIIEIHKNKAKRTVNKINPDIIISPFGHEFYFLDEIKHRSKRILEFHFSKEGMLNFGDYVINKTLYRAQLRYIYWKNEYRMNYYDAIVHLTERDKQYWGNKDKAIVIPNFSVFEAVSMSEENLLNNNFNTIITLANNIAEYSKGYDLLIRAWLLIAEKYPNWNLKIIGGGSKTDLLKSFKKNKLPNNLIFLPPTKDVLSEYLKSSFYVSSSRNEGFGLVLIEALKCGLPVVSFDCPSGPSEIITHGEDGFLVENEDFKKLSIALEELINKSSEEFILMKKAAFNKSQKFSQMNIMTKWENLFKSLKK